MSIFFLKEKINLKITKIYKNSFWISKDKKAYNEEQRFIKSL